MKPNLGMLSTYPPTQCGIATFAQSLVNALLSQDANVEVIRLIDESCTRRYEAVTHQHFNGRGTAVTSSVLGKYDVVIVQHEFGIFGGQDGEEILDLIYEIPVPIIVVLHTVIKYPTEHQRFVLERIIDRADALVTMTYAGRDNLIKYYEVDPNIAYVIPHGSPDLRSGHAYFQKNERPTILTWGLLSEGKGIEWGIDALALLEGLVPKPRYVVAGQTHPKVKAREGEQYRNFLEARAYKKQLRSDVEFIDSYFEAEELKSLIQSADVILLPYDSLVQVTSGVLVEAAVAGKPIVATKFPHALELLKDGSGLLVDQGDSQGMADALQEILSSYEKADRMRKISEKKAHSFLWSTVSEDYLELATSIWANSSGDVSTFAMR